MNKINDKEWKGEGIRWFGCQTGCTVGISLGQVDGIIWLQDRRTEQIIKKRDVDESMEGEDHISKLSACGEIEELSFACSVEVRIGARASGRDIIELEKELKRERKEEQSVAVTLKEYKVAQKRQRRGSEKKSGRARIWHGISSK